MILVSMSCWRERLWGNRPLVLNSGVKVGTVLRVATPICERSERRMKEREKDKRQTKERERESEICITGKF